MSFFCLMLSFRFVDQDDNKLHGLCDIVEHSETNYNPSAWSMEEVDGGKRFVVFQRNMNCINDGEEPIEEENNLDIPSRRILTGNNKDAILNMINLPNNNRSTKQPKNGTNTSGNREPRKFFVSVDSPTNDPFHASPVDISHYSVNSATNKKLSFPSTQESDSNLRLLKGKQMLSSFNPFTKLSHSLQTPYKQPSIKPLDDTPILFSASASVGKYIHPYHTNIKPTKNIGLTLTFVHSPSSSNPSLKSRGKHKHNLLYLYSAYKSLDTTFLHKNT